MTSFFEERWGYWKDIPFRLSSITYLLAWLFGRSVHYSSRTLSAYFFGQKAGIFRQPDLIVPRSSVIRMGMVFGNDWRKWPLTVLYPPHTHTLTSAYSGRWVAKKVEQNFLTFKDGGVGGSAWKRYQSQDVIYNLAWPFYHKLLLMIIFSWSSYFSSLLSSNSQEILSFFFPPLSGTQYSDDMIKQASKVGIGL